MIARPEEANRRQGLADRRDRRLPPAFGAPEEVQRMRARAATTILSTALVENFSGEERRTATITITEKP
jgi:hypothetical protein